MKYNDQSLERALFSLPLEEAPADLRVSILARTIYRNEPAKAWEGWVIGICAAALVWLVLVVARSGFAPVTEGLNSAGSAITAFFGQPGVLLWIAVGSAIALWFSQINLAVAPLFQRVARR
ncbi:MAG TPA: hypothetical protein VGR69_07405 [Candidatus Rubrimentiphilum sp.]|nr:hypothetical protein [Candidatus Rubrimentiphilum sp.]